MTRASNKTHLRRRSQTLGQLSSSNERITREQSRSQHSTSTASNDSFMLDQRITPFIPHSPLHLCLITCNLRSPTIHLTTHLSVTLLKTEVPRWCKQAAARSCQLGQGSAPCSSPGCSRQGRAAGHQHRTSLGDFFKGWDTPRKATLLSSNWGKTGYYFPRQGMDRLVTHLWGCWLSIGYFGLTWHCLRPTWHAEARLNWDAPSVWNSRMCISFLKQFSPQNVQRSTDLNVRWHLYLRVHFRKDILVINLVWVIKVCLHLEIYQNNFRGTTEVWKYIAQSNW